MKWARDIDILVVLMIVLQFGFYYLIRDQYFGTMRLEEWMLELFSNMNIDAL